MIEILNDLKLGSPFVEKIIYGMGSNGIEFVI